MHMDSKGTETSLFRGKFPEVEELRPVHDPVNGIDLSLLEENLKLTPWERILNNNDTINFIDQARAAMALNNAAP